MAKAKMMNENSFAKLVKEQSAIGELIRTRQEEKQSVMNEFDKEGGRYKSGKLSEDTMKSSSAKTNKELARIDKNIRENIMKSNKLGVRIREFVGKQAPISFFVKVSGITLRSKPKKKASKKKIIKSSAKITGSEIRKEVKAEKKFRRK
jgi:hypothetical protein